MATRFDRVTAPVRPRALDPQVELELQALLDRSQLAPYDPSATALLDPTRGELPVRTLASAMAAWLTMVFATCYLAFPMLMAASGISRGVLSSARYSLPAFGLASLVAIVAAVTSRASVRLDTRAPRDPVISATLGGLGVWAIVHNTSPHLLPFTSMSSIEFATFFALNVLEMSLLGMMFASFTQRRGVAMALGGGFQLLVLTLVLTLMSITAL